MDEIDTIDIPRLADESNTDYSLFLLYVQLPRPRIIKDMLQEIPHNPNLSHINYTYDHLTYIARKNHWKDRASQYDVNKQQKLIAIQQQHEITKATTFPEKEDKTIHALDLLKERTITTLESKTLFKPHELRNIAQALDIVQKGERLANGQSTENKTQNTTAEITSTQEQTIELTKTETLLDDNFMKKQIEYGLKLIQKLEK